MNCLSQRKRFKNKHPVWSDPNDPDAAKGPAQVEDEEAEEVREPGGSSSSDDDDDALDMYANDVRSKKYSLQSKELKYKHLANINNERSYKGGIKQVQFNPKSKMALVSMAIGEANLFEVDGERNRHIQHIKIPRTKEPFCSFTPDGNSIVISSKDYRGNFYSYDMISTNLKSYALRLGIEPKFITDFTIFGDYMGCRLEGSREVMVLSSKTYENLFTVKLNEPARTIQFTGNNQMFVAGENARVYIWDLRKTSLCKHRFQDEGSVHSTSMSISESSRLLSIGSDSGVVNSYELDTCVANKFPTPFKTFYNLKTQIDLLKYNPSGELLLMGSRAEMGAFRMVHTHSGTVYRNFPVANKRYGHLLSADFSPLSGYLALGTSLGRAHLCRIPYYGAY